MKKISIFVLSIIALTLIGCTKVEEASASSTSTVAKKVKPGYQLQFSDSFIRGANSVDNEGISIVIVVDVSGSMADKSSDSATPKAVQAVVALKSVVDFIDDIHKKQPDLLMNVAVLKFSNGVDTVFSFNKINDTSIGKLKYLCQIDNFMPDSGTAIGRALINGSEILAQSGTIINSLIVISDGENTNGPDPAEVLTGIYSNNNNKCTSDMEIYTNNQLVSIIGFDTDSSVFSSFSNFGARVISAKNSSELEKSLKDILVADITKLEGN